MEPFIDSKDPENTTAKKNDLVKEHNQIVAMFESGLDKSCSGTETGHKCRS